MSVSWKIMAVKINGNCDMITEKDIQVLFKDKEGVETEDFQHGGWFDEQQTRAIVEELMNNPSVAQVCIFNERWNTPK